MPVTPTYPGIYIEELPSSARTITAAPTSIAVFVGYTHPFKTKPTNFKKAVQIFNFTDYENEFGGLYRSGLVGANVADAVNQFFLNGGTVAYIVGLPSPNISAPTQTVGGIQLQPRELTDLILMNVVISNVQSAGASVSLGSSGDTADVVITYGSRSETYRGVTINTSSDDYIEKRINGKVDKPVSSLVTVSAPGGGYSFREAKAIIQPPSGSTAFNSNDFTEVFKLDSELDKVFIFNLLAIPGIADNGIWSAALAFCERKQAFVVLDPPAQAIAAPDTSVQPSRWIADLMDNVVPKSQNGALYFPYLRSNDPLTGNPIELPPSGFVV